MTSAPLAMVPTVVTTALVNLIFFFSLIIFIKRTFKVAYEREIVGGQEASHKWNSLQ
jgi:hypothetical protein